MVHTGLRKATESVGVWLKGRSCIISKQRGMGHSLLRHPSKDEALGEWIGGDSGDSSSREMRVRRLLSREVRDKVECLGMSLGVDSGTFQRAVRRHSAVNRIEV